MAQVFSFPNKGSDSQENNENASESTPHLTGEARCNGCGHRWVAVVETGREDREWAGNSLECPSCGAEKGVLVKHAVYTGDEIRHWTCSACAGILFSVAKIEGRNPAMCCSNCGNVSDALDLFEGQ